MAAWLSESILADENSDRKNKIAMKSFLNLSFGVDIELQVPPHMNNSGMYCKGGRRNYFAILTRRNLVPVCWLEMKYEKYEI